MIVNTGDGKGKTTAALGMALRAWGRDYRPAATHLVITGRDAPAELIEFANLVTEMQVIKHPYEQGVKAQAGIEY